MGQVGQPSRAPREHLAATAADRVDDRRGDGVGVQQAAGGAAPGPGCTGPGTGAVRDVRVGRGGRQERRVDDGDAHALRGELVAQRFEQSGDRVLAGHVGGAAQHRGEPGDAGHRHDPPPGRPQGRQGGPGRPHRPVQVDVQDLLEGRVAGLVEGPQGGDAGVGDQHVQAPEPVGGSRRGTDHVLGVGDVDPVGPGGGPFHPGGVRVDRPTLTHGSPVPAGRPRRPRGRSSSATPGRPA